MVCARVIVLPDPVTPSSVWNLSPRFRPAVSSAMALGWSPAGEKGAMTSNRGLLIEGIYTAGLCSGTTLAVGVGFAGGIHHRAQREKPQRTANGFVVFL